MRKSSSTGRDLLYMNGGGDATRRMVAGASPASTGTTSSSRPAITAGCISEDDSARLCLVCSPDLPKMMGSLHPRGSLYERPVNLDEAKRQHALFGDTMREAGCHVLDVRDVLLYGCDRNLKARIELEELALRALTYKLAEDAPEGNQQCKQAVSEEYKRTVVESMSSEQLVDVVVTRPTVAIGPSFRDTGLHATYTFSPLTNLVFTRDQQITTSKGIVMGKLRSNQRSGEVEVMKHCFAKLGLNIIGQVSEPGYLEGGDFFPAGEDLCFIGIGMRSNMEAVAQLLAEDLFGTSRVAVVNDIYDQSQDRMHLDCTFSLLGGRACILYEHSIGHDAKHRRMVTEYTRVAVNKPYDGVLPVDWSPEKDIQIGHYRRSRCAIPFDEYLEENGYTIIPVSAEDQLAYGCNCLNLGAGNIISVNNKTARDIARCDKFQGKVEYLDFSAITCMYGAVHCGSQILYREKISE